MAQDLHDTMRTLGELARTADLEKLGHRRAAVERAVREGWMLRPARYWVATRAAPVDAVIAVRHRGKLTSASALASYGVWRADDRRIHVLVPPGSRAKATTPTAELGAFARSSWSGVGVTRHWGVERAVSVTTESWRVSAVDALAQFGRVHGVDPFVAAIDNALHVGALRPADLPVLFSIVPKRLRGASQWVDGRAEAASESLARLRISRFAERVQIQVQIGPHRLDLLIDGWLNIEIDSSEFHDKRALEDNTRDTWLIGRGFRVKRFSYEEVLNDWPSVELAIRELLRQPRPRVQPSQRRKERS